MLGMRLQESIQRRPTHPFPDDGLPRPARKGIQFVGHAVQVVPRPIQRGRLTRGFTVEGVPGQQQQGPDVVIQPHSVSRWKLLPGAFALLPLLRLVLFLPLLLLPLLGLSRHPRAPCSTGSLSGPLLLQRGCEQMRRWARRLVAASKPRPQPRTHSLGDARWPTAHCRGQ